MEYESKEINHRWVAVSSLIIIKYRREVREIKIVRYEGTISLHLSAFKFHDKR